MNTSAAKLSRPLETDIISVDTPALMKDFIDLPWQIYRNDPNWVPPLKEEVAFKLNTEEHPYYQHSDLQVFLAVQSGQVVGRIAACVNHNHNAYHQQQTAFFGFFECVDDHSVAAALFDAAQNWARIQGCNRLLGPFSMSIDEEVGFLFEGYDSKPVMQMPYNPPYYHDLCLEQGFSKAKDLYAWRKAFEDRPVSMPENLSRLGCVLRPLRPAELAAELDQIMEIYNTTFTRHWGYVPLTREEIRQMHDDLKEVLDPELVMFAEINGRVAGFGIALPNYNEVLDKLNGRLGVIGVLKFLWWKRKIRSVRTFVVGVAEEYRTSGLAFYMQQEFVRLGYQLGYDWYELSWTLEDNHAVNGMIRKTGSEQYKTYRIYGKDLD